MKALHHSAKTAFGQMSVAHRKFIHALRIEEDFLAGNEQKGKQTIRLIRNGCLLLAGTNAILLSPFCGIFLCHHVCV